MLHSFQSRGEKQIISVLSISKTDKNVFMMYLGFQNSSIACVYFILCMHPKNLKIFHLSWTRQGFEVLLCQQILSIKNCKSFFLHSQTGLGGKFFPYSLAVPSRSTQQVSIKVIIKTKIVWQKNRALIHIDCHILIDKKSDHQRNSVLLYF